MLDHRPPTTARPVRLLLAWVTWVATAAVGVVAFDGDAIALLAVTSVGLVALTPLYFAIYTRRAFRWLVVPFVPLPLVTILGGGLALVPVVALLVAAAKAPPPPDDWRLPSWLAGLLVATAAAFGLLLLFLAATR